MATEAQIAANRLNAQKSTGPRTAEGKERASQNALTHGLFAREGVIRGEDEDQFEDHRERLLGQLCPAGPLEEILAARIVELSWRLRRAVQDQSDAFVAMYDRQTAAGPAGGMGEVPGNAALPSGDAREANQEIGGPREATVGRMILEDFGRSAVLERLLRYERRIESSLYRTLNELRRVHDQAVKADREDINTLERWREEDWNARKARSFAFTPPAQVAPEPAGVGEVGRECPTLDGSRADSTKRDPFLAIRHRCHMPVRRPIGRRRACVKSRFFVAWAWGPQTIIPRRGSPSSPCSIGRMPMPLITHPLRTKCAKRTQFRQGSSFRDRGSAT